MSWATGPARLRSRLFRPLPTAGGDRIGAGLADQFAIPIVAGESVFATEFIPLPTVPLAGAETARAAAAAGAATSAGNAGPDARHTEFGSRTRGWFRGDLAAWPISQGKANRTVEGFADSPHGV